jgi:hypothetical protein
MSRSVAFLGFSTSSKSGQQHQHNTNSRRRRALFSFFKKSGNGDDEKNAPTDCVKVEEDANDASSLRRAISLSQSFCAIASTTGGFNNFELVPPTSFDDDDDDVVFFPPRGATFKEERRLMRLNQRPLWTEEDGYEREMRLATASFLAATTLAVGQPAVALDFVVVDPAVKEYMDRRDDAMSFKCKGGMMDCDGDRREFARNQAEGLKTRLEKGEKRTECTIEEPCTDNILGAAVAGTSGFTTAEKFEKMGRPELADAPNSSKPNLGF